MTSSAAINSWAASSDVASIESNVRAGRRAERLKKSRMSGLDLFSEHNKCDEEEQPTRISNDLFPVIVPQEKFGSKRD